MTVKAFTQNSNYKRPIFLNFAENISKVVPSLEYNLQYNISIFFSNILIFWPAPVCLFGMKIVLYMYHQVIHCSSIHAVHISYRYLVDK